MAMLDSAGEIKPLVERLRQIAQEGREIIEPWQLDPYLYDEAADTIDEMEGNSRRMTRALVEIEHHSTDKNAAATARAALALEQSVAPEDGK